MKVALFLPSLRGGGAERVMVNLANGFAEHGLQVDLVLARAEGPYLNEIAQDVRLVDLGAKRVLRSLPGLIAYLRRERPDAMLSAMDHANLVALWARKIAGAPTRMVVSVHNTTSRTVANAHSLKARYMPRLMQLFYPWAQAVVAVSAGVAEDLVDFAGLPRNKIYVIYNPVVTSDMLSRAEQPLDHPWFRPGEPPVVMGAGRLTVQKDFPTLIRAFHLLRREVPARLIIISEGEERSRLETLVQELKLDHDVALPGFVSNPYNLMKHADVFVLSSKWEGLPTVLIEALALGTSVVSTDCPSGPAEILENGKWGRLVPVGDVPAMATAILDAMRDRINPNASKYTKKFSMNSVVREYLKVLEIDT